MISAPSLLARMVDSNSPGPYDRLSTSQFVSASDTSLIGKMLCPSTFQRQGSLMHEKV
jgi:hypothetical protein